MLIIIKYKIQKKSVLRLIDIIVKVFTSRNEETVTELQYWNV